MQRRECVQDGAAIGWIRRDLLKRPHREAAQAGVGEPSPKRRNGGSAVARDCIAQLDPDARISGACGSEQPAQVVGPLHRQPVSARVSGRGPTR
jgi:hypothetical protein